MVVFQSFDSPIHGSGLQAVVECYDVGFWGFQMRGRDLAQTRLGQLVNHSRKPNLIAELGYDGIVYRATHLVEPGDEVTLDYRQVGPVARAACVEHRAWRVEISPGVIIDAGEYLRTPSGLHLLEWI